MISPNEFRWDFIGLSTEDKPTPETSENVTNGSTFFEVDTSKLYVWCDTEWYEKQSTGGGGGGDKPVIKVLTTDDYNTPTSNPNRIALYKLPDGIYKIADGNVRAYADESQNYKYGLGTGEYCVVVSKSNAVSCFIERYGACIMCSVTTSTGSVSSYNERPTSVVDNLTSTDVSAALSAKQGKVLNEKINVVALPLTLNEGTGVLTSQQTCGQIKSLINEGKIFIPYVMLADSSLVEGGIVIISRENTGGNMVIYIFDGDSAQFILISLSADTDNDYFTGSLPS